MAHAPDRLYSFIGLSEAKFIQGTHYHPYGLQKLAPDEDNGVVILRLRRHPCGI